MLLGICQTEDQHAVSGATNDHINPLATIRPEVFYMLDPLLKL